MTFSSTFATSFAEQPADFSTAVQSEFVDSNQTVHRLSEARIASIVRCVDSLESDSPVVRRLAADRLYSQASNGNTQTCDAILSRLRGLRVSFSLDVRQLADQLIERIRLTRHQRAVAELTPSPWGDSPSNLDRELDQWWQQFSRRAGADRDSIREFQYVALTAGPDWRWVASVNDQPTNQSASDEWACLLGIRVPECGTRYVPEAKKLQSRLLAKCTRSSAGSTSADRVVGRLIDSTVRRNPYGWSLESRLEIALTHQRPELVGELCELTWNTPNVHVRDLALSLLAADRVNHASLTEQLNERVNDRRVITVLPGQAHFGVGEADWPRSIVVPRINDVVQYLFWKHQGMDARQHGMTAIQADPVWGVRLESIGR
ncbi:hypothetical protein [Rhodopirellula bahusiensis]|uniref:Uncharacterized protein n=1 Tax=Rhodopirellula bahusiensis TaxID=2014065 RepID=A0A2G1W5U1_9BACT|nr:hypothetical protein [Rhodopirellula bahusiensis]PHQ34398.1 hypothetical protein CEE69_15405 [Rhodopirellula bahusiensis]